MQLKSLEGVDVAGKKVLVRVDFNVELDDHQDVLEQYKLTSAKRTIEYLVGQGVRVAMVTHFGRPDGKVNEKYSLQQIADDAERALGVEVLFVPTCVGDEVVQALESLSAGQVLLLENVRFFPGEETNDAAFAQQLAAPFDLFVNEAFSVCHRDQASVTAVTQYLPSVAGYHLLDEVKHLSRALAPEHPAVAIIGGAKIETKLPVISAFESVYDTVLVGSKIADEALAQQQFFSDKVILPTDYAEDHLDIGSETVSLFTERLQDARMIVWNGPLGKFEQPPFDMGTRAVLEAMIASGAMTIVGGGESVQVLEAWGLFDKIGFVSTGGGAMLDFLAGAPMPGLEALHV
jgi:phosphoglycerate kinase